MKTTAKQLFAIATETNKRKDEKEKAKDMKFVEDVIPPICARSTMAVPTTFNRVMRVRFSPGTPQTRDKRSLPPSAPEKPAFLRRLF